MQGPRITHVTTWDNYDTYTPAWRELWDIRIWLEIYENTAHIFKLNCFLIISIDGLNLIPKLMRLILLYLYINIVLYHVNATHVISQTGVPQSFQSLRSLDLPQFHLPNMQELLYLAVCTKHTNSTIQLLPKTYHQLCFLWID